MLSIETIIALSTFEKIIVRAILMQKERRVLGSKLIVFLANQISKARFYDLINKLIEYSIIGKEIIEKQTYYFLKDPCEIEKKEEERKKALK
ncbi:MAG: hypothetical protein U9Q15_04720 [Patescibacteria group bacterium]|nr:hypothetical protein [Patescibacteria group bacterium]